MSKEVKAAELYMKVCEKLDHIQGAVYELLNMGQVVEQAPMELIKYATTLVEEYDRMTPEERTKVIELGDAIVSGTISMEEAMEVAPSLGVLVGEDKDEYLAQRANTTKKPLLN